MRIGELLFQVINELNKQGEKPDNYGNQNITVKVDPKYKAVISFLLNLSTNTLEDPYHEVETGIRWDGPFSYGLSGQPDQIILVAKAHFFRHGGHLQDYFEKLRSAINSLIKNLAEGWMTIPSDQKCMKNYFPGLYENANIAGINYAFMLNELAYVLNYNQPGKMQLGFDAWVPNVGTHLIASKIYLYGEEESCKKFLASIPAELKMSSKLFADNENEKVATFNVKTSANHCELEIKNMTFPGAVSIKLTNQPSGTTLIQQMTKKNERQITINVGTETCETSLQLK